MKKTIIFSIFLFITIGYSYAQTPVGLLYDMNAVPLNGYFDPLTYLPGKRVKISKLNFYEEGYCSYFNGNKEEGLIRFQGGNFFLKRKGQSDEKKINTKSVNYFLMGVDSFFMIKDFYIEKERVKGFNFMQYIAEVNGYTFVKLHGDTYLVKGSGEKTWKTFGHEKPLLYFRNKKEFKEKALKYFGHIPILNDRISSGVYGIDDMATIIKIAEYQSKYQKEEPILYDKHWREVRDVEKVEYLSQIIHQQDSVWTLEHYKGSVKLYQANYSPPNIKNGDFIAYYHNGEVRQIISYKNNKAQEVRCFDEVGNLNVHYQCTHAIRYPTIPSSWEYVDIEYIVVNDSLGNNILKSNERTTLDVYDEFKDLTYTSIYRENRLVSRYRLLGSDTIFQITNPKYDFKIGRLQIGFDDYVLNNNYVKAFDENAQGTILVSLLIDNKGNIVESTILNDADTEIGILADNFIARWKNRYKLKPYRKDKIKRYCEVVIPIEFRTKRDYSLPINHHNDPFFMNDHMMNKF